MKFQFLLLFALANHVTFAQQIWENQTYPDETGFKLRNAPMLMRLAANPFGQRSLALSTCPDTGLPVKVWAVEGETIYSPYTGRAYTQGPTGYFGPKERNKEGEIIKFGGDPLKYDLPPATAAMLLDNGHEVAKAYLSIPGNLSQQYHFACKNWARFYPLLKDVMGAAWQADFQNAVANYSEKRRPSDGDREYAPLSAPHTLVGQPGHLLGGNPTDGGTENHKTMWRTSALLYSQLFPEVARISSVPAAQAEQLTKEMIRDYLKRLLLTGNGEYDSQVYYPHSIEAFFNLYDFSPDPETKQLAKFALDYYFATFGLKVIDGAIAGAQKRGYLPGEEPGEMEVMLWNFFDHSSRDMSAAVATIQQATTSYRPNQVIWNLVTKQVPVPFESKMSRPFYHMDRPHAFAETFYCSKNFAIGSVQMTIVDNPNQQMVWSLIAKGSNGPLAFSGGHPMRGSTSGHSPYTQVLQSGPALIVMTAPTEIDPDINTEITPEFPDRHHLWHLSANEQGEDFEQRDRQKYAARELHRVDRPDPYSAESLADFFNQSKGSASTWFFYPRTLQPVQQNGNLFLETPNAWIVLDPLFDEFYVIQPEDFVIEALPRSASRFFSSYALAVFPGKKSGYVMQAFEKKDYPTLETLEDHLNKNVSLSLNGLEISYQSPLAGTMKMKYNPKGLRPAATINGKKQNFDHYTQGAVYQSPYISIRNGRMRVSDGKQAYSVFFNKKGIPVWKSER